MQPPPDLVKGETNLGAKGHNVSGLREVPEILQQS